mmetsp:Transcript_19265/g.63309  ORF Transcript_19265/g.63309 Transcript_19265/m.63309 type:complete len:226 (-) Transcript_19265:449-1126(-)
MARGSSSFAAAASLSPTAPPSTRPLTAAVSRSRSAARFAKAAALASAAAAFSAASVSPSTSSRISPCRGRSATVSRRKWGSRASGRPSRRSLASVCTRYASKDMSTATQPRRWGWSWKRASSAADAATLPGFSSTTIFFRPRSPSRAADVSTSASSGGRQPFFSGSDIISARDSSPTSWDRFCSLPGTFSASRSKPKSWQSTKAPSLDTATSHSASASPDVQATS